MRSAAEHAVLVAALQDEYIADDLSPPSEAASWSAAACRRWFEGGGVPLPDTAADDASCSSGPTLISLGSFCNVAQLLVALDARRHAGPFDWLHGDLELALSFLEADCSPTAILSHPSNLRRVQDHGRTTAGTHEWRPAEPAAVGAAGEGSAAAGEDDDRGVPAIGHSIPGVLLQDTTTGAVFPHDFVAGPVAAQFDAVAQKYARRAGWMREMLQRREVVLLYARNAHLSGADSPHAPALLERADRVLRRWPRARLECWDATDGPLELERVRNHDSRSGLAAEDATRKKRLYQLLGLRVMEMGAVGAGGGEVAALIVQTLQQELQGKGQVR